MQIEIDDMLVERIKEVLKYPHFRAAENDAEDAILHYIEKGIVEDEKGLNLTKEEEQPIYEILRPLEIFVISKKENSIMYMSNIDGKIVAGEASLD